MHWTISLVLIYLSPLAQAAGNESAGRVQSVALRLICERETEIENLSQLSIGQLELNSIKAPENP